jgi:DNA end-binding protein Ku
MARPYWSGQIQISLVQFGVKLFVATEAKSEIRFHQIDRASGERVKHQKVLASAVEASPDDAAPQESVVERSQIVKGYEYSKGHYITLEPEELAHLRVPSKHVMEVTQFVDESAIDPEYFEKPYFVVPENEAQTEAFLTVRQALLDTGKIGLSKIAFAGREHVVAINAAGTADHPGMMAYTMRYAAELRNPAEYFRDIKKMSVSADSLDLAKELIKRKAGKFDPTRFIDGYEVAVKELVDAKLKHAPIPQDEAPAPERGTVINLMDALRKSISGGVKDAASRPAADKPAAEKREPKSDPRRGPTLVKNSVKAHAKPEPKAARPAAKRKTA